MPRNQGQKLDEMNERQYWDSVFEDIGFESRAGPRAVEIANLKIDKILSYIMLQVTNVSRDAKRFKEKARGIMTELLIVGEIGKLGERLIDDLVPRLSQSEDEHLNLVTLLHTQRASRFYRRIFEDKFETGEATLLLSKLASRHVVTGLQTGNGDSGVRLLSF